MCTLLTVLALIMPCSGKDSLSAAAQSAGQRDSTAASAEEKGIIDRMTVRADRSRQDTGIEKHASVIFSSKQIKSTAGAAGDISRYLGTLPSVVASLGAKFDNTLFVRGGRPSEITFLVDGIEMENINHFSQANGSGGPIGFINADFIRSVRFYAGDIPVSYPAKMSSVVDIAMKSGSFSSVHSNVGVKLTGGIASVEGPAFGHGASFALAGRYIDFTTLRSIIGDEGIPRLGDLFGKLLFLPSKNLTVSATGIFSYNTYRYDFPIQEQGDGWPAYPNTLDEKQKILQGGAGVLVHYKDETQEHRVGLGYSVRNGASYDSLESFSDSFYAGRYAKNPVRSAGDDRSHLTLNTNSSFTLAANQTLSAGVRVNDTRYGFSYSDEAKNSGTCVVCRNDSPVTVAWTLMPVEKSLQFQGMELGVFLNHTLVAGPFATSAGVRADYYTLLDNIVLSPRIAGTFSLGKAGTILGGIGLYHQFPTDLPSILFGVLSVNALQPADSMRQSERFLLRQAKPLRCWQGSLGYDATPWGILASKCELYYKWYDQEYQFIAPDVQDVVYTKENGALGMRPQDGRRRVYGLEASIANAGQSWLSYSLGGSLFDVKNRFDNTEWYNDWTNVGYTITCAVAAIFFRDHTLSLSFTGSGGRPFCPEVVRVDCVGRRSAAIDTTQAYYARRLDRLLTTNARYGFTRRILGSEVESFVEIINLFNYKPVLEYKFNGAGFQAVTPFGITPIIGINVRF